jgi:hypothetical protein
MEKKIIKNSIINLIFILYLFISVKLIICTINNVAYFIGLLCNLYHFKLYRNISAFFSSFFVKKDMDVLFEFLQMHLDFTVFSLIFCLSFIIYQLKYHEYNWKFSNWKDFVFLLIFCFCIYEGIHTFIDLFKVGYKVGDLGVLGTWSLLEGSFFLNFVKTVTISLFCLGLFLCLLVYKNLNYTLSQKILIILFFSILVYVGSFASYFVLVGYPSAMSACFEVDPIHYNLEVLKNFQNTLVSKYSLISISSCNPENIEPCLELKQKMESSFCQASNFVNNFFPHFPRGSTTVVFEAGKTLTNSFCEQKQFEYYDCLDAIRREIWVKRYIELHHTPKYQIPIHKIVFPRPKI